MRTIAMFYAIILTLAVPMFQGCQNPERATLAITSIEINTGLAAMRAFVQYEKIHGASADTRAKLNDAWTKFRTANLAAETAWLAYKTAADGGDPNATALQNAATIATATASAAEASLIQLVRLFTK